MKTSRFQKLKKDVEQLQREKERSIGVISQLKKKLKQDFSCQTLKKARKLLLKLEREENEAETNFNKAHKRFGREWKGRLQRD